MTPPTALGAWDIRGRCVVITGATRGIGLAAALALAERGAQVTVVARNAARAAATVARIRAVAPGAAGDAVVGDLSEQAQVRRLAAEIERRHGRIDVLVNNAGAIYGSRRMTTDGVELSWAVNHIAPFLLTNLLLPVLRESAPARVITTSSDAHLPARIPFDDIDAVRSYGWGGFRRYGQTKLANILFTTELARRLSGSGVVANCFHPGLVATGWNRNNGLLMRVGMDLARPMSRSPERGADTLVWLVASPEGGAESGGYFVDRRRTRPSARARDADVARRLWELSERQAGLSAT